MLDHSTALARITQQIEDAESLANAALQAQARLMDTLVTARIDTGGAITQGHEAIARLQKAQSQTISTCADLGRVHSAMRAVGVEVKMMTDENDCPDRKMAQLKIA